ncbi:MAG: PAS domain-containing protein [Vicinamibacterales bacterium]
MTLGLPANVRDFDSTASMKVLYLKGTDAEVDRQVLHQLLTAAPEMELTPVGAAVDALDELRRMLGWEAILVSPSVATADTTALISTVRRDRLPVALIPILDAGDQDALIRSLTAGADVVLTMHDHRVLRIPETLARLSHSPHFPGPPLSRRLHVLYVGHDPSVWDLLDQLSFVTPTRLAARQLTDSELDVADTVPCDVVVVDDDPENPVPAEILHRVRTRAPDAPAILLSPWTGQSAPPPALDLEVDSTFVKTGLFQHQLVGTLRKLHENLELRLREAETRTREERLREIVERVPTEIVVLGCDAVVLALNEAAMRLFGATSPRQIVGRDFQSLVETDDPDELANALRADADQGAATVRLRVRTEQGQLVECTLRANPLGREGAGRRGVVAALSPVVGADRHTGEVDEAQVQQTALGARLESEEAVRQTLRAELAQQATELRSREVQLRELRQALDDTRAELASLGDQVAREQARSSEAKRLQAIFEEAFTRTSADRDRLMSSALFGYALTAGSGELMRCNDTFATMFGYQDARDALAHAAGKPFAPLAGRHRIDDALQRSGSVVRLQSIVHTLQGQPVAVVESATRLPDTIDDQPLVERLFVQMQAPEGLEAIMARRLQDVGVLAVSMAPALETLTGALTGIPPSPDALGPEPENRLARLHALTRQLAGFARRQTAELLRLDLTEVLRETQPLLTRVLGPDVSLELNLDADVPVVVSRSDLEHLLVALAVAAREVLPMGGIVCCTTSGRFSTAQPARAAVALTMTATGFGARAPFDSRQLMRAAGQCNASAEIHSLRDTLIVSVRFPPLSTISPLL